MTRKGIIKTLEELGFSNEAAEIKYYNIRDFLRANGTPIKAITQIKIANDYGDTVFGYFPSVHVELGKRFGWLEV
jgi:hypothetical protein